MPAGLTSKSPQESAVGENGEDMAVFDVVTGAFGYSGKYITQRLLALGHPVKTLTRRRPQDADPTLAVAPLDFADRDGLINDLRGAAVLFNTYWVRFPYGRTTFEQAVANTEKLIDAAVVAGVPRIVQLSVTNASATSPLPYFRGKGLVEEAIVHSGLSYAIIRPTVIFGPEDILLNNIAWLLRRFPLFGVPGTGRYRIQPVSVEDVADLAVAAGNRTNNIVQDAAGTEVYTFEELVRSLANAMGSQVRAVHLPPAVTMLIVAALGRLVHDIVLTSHELQGLMAGLLVSGSPPTGWRRFSEWLAHHADSLGLRYANELDRHYR